MDSTILIGLNACLEHATPSLLAVGELPTPAAWSDGGWWGRAGQWGETWLIGQAILFLVIAARIAGMATALPTVTRLLPMRFRVIAVVLFALVLFPGVHSTLSETPFDTSLASLPFVLGREFVFGMIIGGVVQLLITGIQLAGELIASVSGMQLAQTADPSTGQPTPQLASLFGLLVTVLLFAAGGHRLLIDGLLNSFHDFPPSAEPLGSDHLRLVIDHLSAGIEAGLRVAAPVVGCVLLSNVVVALVSRSVPQLNVLAVGLNINLMAALVVMGLTIGSAGLVFQTELRSALKQLGSTAVPSTPR